jgi:hypothetical protein
MPKPFLFLYGNCQMNRLAQGFALQPEVDRLFRVRKVQNFNLSGEDADPRHVEQAAEFEREAANIGVIIYQAEVWDKNAAHIMSRLPADCVKIPVFSVALSTLWPFYFKDMPIRKVKWPGYDGNYFPYGDTYLTRQVKAGAEPEDIVRGYMALDVNAATPLDDWRAGNLANLRKKEETSAVRISDLLDERFETVRCFWTINHAANEVFRLMVDQLLDVLGLARLDPRVGDEFGGHVGFGNLLHQRVHPRIIEHYGLGYLGPETLYKHWNDALTFEEWTRRYVALSRQAHGLVQGAAA